MVCVIIHEVPKCLEDEVYTTGRGFFIKFSDGTVFAHSFNYCPTCDSYMTKDGKMEKDIKKVVLDFFKPFGKLSDIVEVKKW